jgi:hypothetical protein
MSENSNNHRSITNARKYLDYLFANNKDIDLPEIPTKCIISYTTEIIEITKQIFPHKSVNLGCTNPTNIHFFFPNDRNNFAIARGLHGAPMAAVLLEELIALGFEEFLVVGASGHPTNQEYPVLNVGDLLLTTNALIFEGTSAHYSQNRSIQPSARIIDRLKENLTNLGIIYQEGAIATTDALYRETEEFIKLLIQKNVLAVDMEMSALFTVAHHHEKHIGGLLFISDLIKEDGSWELGLLGDYFDKLQEKLAIIVREFITSK